MPHASSMCMDDPVYSASCVFKTHWTCTSYVHCCTLDVHMDVYSPSERRFLTAVSNLAYSNPFLPERLEYEKAALGRDFVPGGPVWSASVSYPDPEPPNLIRLHARLEPMIESIHARMERASDMTAADLAIYEESV